MIKVRKGNVILRVEDYAEQHYIDLGYNVIDENGKVLKSALPNNIGELRKLYVEQKQKIEELEATIAKLTANKEIAKKKPTNKTKAE